MKKQALLLGVLLLSAACTPNGKLMKTGELNGCPGDGTGVTFTPVWYGDSYLAAFEISEIALGSRWFFKLLPQTSATDPDGVDYEQVAVTVKAKLAGNQAWLDETRTFAAAPDFSLCVPHQPGDVDVGPDGYLEYEVSVEEVGILDPRARVIEK